MSKYLQEYPAHVVKRFLKFKSENPQVYGHFERMAKQIKKTGREKYSARTIFEVLRWHLDIETQGEPFKISNDFIPMYVRFLIAQEPDFDGFFTVKRKRR